MNLEYWYFHEEQVTRLINHKAECVHQILYTMFLYIAKFSL